MLDFIINQLYDLGSKLQCSRVQSLDSFKNTIDRLKRLPAGQPFNPFFYEPSQPGTRPLHSQGAYF